MLLPGMLREARPELEIGYFHHIPFPSYELFRILPERAEVLRGLLGADLVAFHTHDYMRHFISTVERVLHLDFRLDEVQLGNRVVRVNALPMGINYDLYHGASQKPRSAPPSNAPAASSDRTSWCSPWTGSITARASSTGSGASPHFWSTIPNTAGR